MIFSDFSTCRGTQNLLECDDASSEMITPEELDCYKAENGCLFNMESDPCELVNVGEQHRKIREEMIAALDEFEENAGSHSVTLCV